MSVTYRDAAIADGPALADMGRRCFVETFGPHFPPDDMTLHLGRMFGPEGLSAELHDPDLRVRMAEENGEIAAYLKLAPMSLPVPHEPGALEVKQLYVLGLWQGAGVAAVLMDSAIETARSEGAPAIYLSVWEQGARAIAFYARRGFVQIGVAPFQLGSRAYQDPVMRLGL
ncbi:GNAT family N-acetyltransferase [Sphingosinicella sp.]|uniref:GNAT family N-acetyltransferase n=1 Tax=Sphingosinicella sp. TaxID=1917971 RepID=UPI0040383095